MDVLILVLVVALVAIITSLGGFWLADRRERRARPGSLAAAIARAEQQNRDLGRSLDRLESALRRGALRGTQAGSRVPGRHRSEGACDE